MTCVGINRSGTNPAPSLFDEGLLIQRRHEAFSVRDALVVSLPLTEQTRGLIGAADWRACKRGVHVISVGRGPVVQMLPCLKHWRRARSVRQDSTSQIPSHCRQTIHSGGTPTY